MNKVHDFDSYFQYYLTQAGTDGIEVGLEKTRKHLIELLPVLESKGGDYAYDQGKWTIKELLMHLVDSELIFNYRALRFARNDATELSGYDHDEYVSNYDLSNLTLKEIVSLFDQQRQFTIQLFKSFTSDMRSRNGVANGMKIDVDTIGKVIVGHQNHHVKVLQERYL